MKRFWNWSSPAPDGDRVLHITGPIAEESWFGDEATPDLFASELNKSSADVRVWVNSPGGDCIAAAQIYNLLLEYPGQVTVIIDGIAASAASVIAMAGSQVLMTPVSMMMIHNPATLAAGDKSELGRAIEMLDAVKESIINAYELKTGMQRAKLARLMDAETWMDARAAIEMGFADAIHNPDKPTTKTSASEAGVPVVFNRRQAELALVNKLTQHAEPSKPDKPPERAAPDDSSDSDLPATPAGRSFLEAYVSLTNRK